ncbi:MAG: hypothetical protein R3F01_00035 [Lysobacteraceae bacterium]
MLLIFHPLCCGGAWSESPRDRAQEAREFFVSTGMCCRKTPTTRREPPKAAQRPGVLSFGSVFFGQAKKMNSTAPKAMSKALDPKKTRRDHRT